MSRDLAVVLLSGGMDSLVVLAEAKTKHKEVATLHLDYGHKTKQREKKSFDDISNYYNIPQELRKRIDMSFLSQIGGSSLTDLNIEVSQYQGDSPVIPSSYVPFRNTHLLAMAVSWAEVIGAKTVYIGANEEDSPGYPDCRPLYYQTFNQLIKVGTKEGKIEVQTPIIHLTKKEIVLKGQQYRVPFQFSWSCYAREDMACGECDSCALRLRGFHQAGLQDPISYAKK